MALIKTDSQNYTDIANEIRELVGCKTFFDENITTTYNYSGYYGRNMFASDYKFEDIISNYQQRVGEVFEVVCDDISYFCELKVFENSCYYLGNLFTVYNDDASLNTGEPFCISAFSTSDDESIIGKVGFCTEEAKTYHLAVVKNHYKPEEMAKALDENYPDYGVSYDTLSGNGENPVTGSTYGYKAVGFAENSALSSVNISDKTREIGDYAFHYCSQLSISTLPEGVEIIGCSAFYRCNAITSFTFPKSIKKIGGSAFDYCTGLRTVTFKGTPDEIASTAFAMTSYITFNVPWSEGEVAGYPWGVTTATINYNYTGE